MRRRLVSQAWMVVVRPSITQRSLARGGPGHCWFAKNATDADARLNMQILKSAENDIASGFRSAKDCTAEAVERAKDVAARAHKAEAGNAR